MSRAYPRQPVLRKDRQTSCPSRSHHEALAPSADSGLSGKLGQQGRREACMPRDRRAPCPPPGRAAGGRQAAGPDKHADEAAGKDLNTRFSLRLPEAPGWVPGGTLLQSPHRDPLPHGRRLAGITVQIPRDSWGEAANRQRGSGRFAATPSTCSSSHPKGQVSIF